DAVKDAASLAKVVAHHHAIGVPSIFWFDSETDQRDASRVIGGLRQAGLTLPDREYYVKDDAKSKEKRANLLLHVETMLGLAGETRAHAKAHAAVVVRIET
ncbi:M13 family peptidase, partial [Clostridioides difficile]|uniref:hypothetical protein n=1 Tax=Clostridioides difficile TaxID=1496 RepID=UPI0018DE78CE